MYYVFNNEMNYKEKLIIIVCVIKSDSNIGYLECLEL